MPNESVVYLGDNANAPYSGKPTEELKDITRRNIDFLLEKQVKAILIACGTLSAMALPLIRNDYDIPILGVIEPTARRAVQCTKIKKVAVFSTVATAESHAFYNAIAQMDAQIQCREIGCFRLAPMIEKGIIDRNSEELRQAIAEYASPVKDWEMDTIILGCTHYPVVADSFRDYLGKVEIVEAGKEGALELQRELESAGLLSDSASPGSNTIYVSGAAEKFAGVGKYLFGKPIEVNPLG